MVVKDEYELIDVFKVPTPPEYFTVYQVCTEVSLIFVGH